MKVAFIVRSNLFSVQGGDTIQVIQTAGNLKKLGIAVDIKLANERVNYNEYQLLHFLNIIRPNEILHHINKTSIPFVVSPNLVDYSSYDKYQRPGISGFIFQFSSTDAIEYMKTLARSVMEKEYGKVAGLKYFLKGHKNSIVEILRKCAMVLPNSELEYEQLVQRYHVSPGYSVVHNGIDPGIFHWRNDADKLKDLVLCVARIEGIKNQLTLIKALNDTRFKLVIIGDPAPNQMSYFRKCRAIAGKNVHFIGHRQQIELVPYYQDAKVHVLSSWFETCGLSSLEAGAMGCNLVVTNNGYTREYYENSAVYCDPGSPKSILQAVMHAAAQPNSTELSKRIISRFTWEQAAAKTAGSYKKIIR